MLLTASEIELNIRDTGGVEVALGGVTTWGHLQEVSEEALGDEFRGAIAHTRTTLAVVAGVLPGFVDGAFVTVGDEEEGSSASGTVHRVVSPMRYGIGKVRCVLGEVTGG